MITLSFSANSQEELIAQIIKYASQYAVPEGAPLAYHPGPPVDVEKKRPGRPKKNVDASPTVMQKSELVAKACIPAESAISPEPSADNEAESSKEGSGVSFIKITSSEYPVPPPQAASTGINDALNKVKESLKMVIRKCGILKATEIAASVGAENVSGISPMRYHEVIALCEKALEGKAIPSEKA